MTGSIVLGSLCVCVCVCVRERERERERERGCTHALKRGDLMLMIPY
jgi:hypothetical protein